MMRTGMVLVVVLLLAGCSGQSEMRFVSAGEVRDAAYAIAKAWAPDASLTFVYAVEPTTRFDTARLQSAVPGLSLYLKADPVVGDGRAQAWWYEFVSAERKNASHSWVLGAGGKILEDNDLDQNFLGRQVVPHEDPIEPWALDSSQASDAARANATWLPLLNSTQPAVLVALVDALEGDPHWVFRIASGNVPLGELSVNAKSGATVPRPPFLVNPTTVGGWFEGNLSSDSRADGFQLPISVRRYEALEFYVVLEPPAITSIVNLTVRSPDGLVGSREVEGRGLEVTRGGFSFFEPSRGDWTISVSLKEGILQHYLVAWCARGEPAEVRPTACAR